MDDYKEDDLVTLIDEISEEEHSWAVPFVGLREQFLDERARILDVVEEVFLRGTFVGPSHVEEFESAIADYLGVKYVLGVGSGTDALYLALRSLEICDGDEVITVGNSHFSTVSAIVHTGAEPVLADVRSDLNMDPVSAESLITPKTKAILPVHLTGRPADMDAIVSLAKRYNLYVIEDAAQSIGSKYYDKFTGTLGHVSAFSAHPLKNLNAAGDAGFLTTEDCQIAHNIRSLRNNGLEGRDNVRCWGVVSRLDILQAAILTMRLEYLDQVILNRRRNAEIYLHELPQELATCPPAEHEFHTYHNFVVQTDRREELRDHLLDHGVATAIHYPTPIHLQPAARRTKLKHQDLSVTEMQARRILSLPIHQYLTNGQIELVIEKVREFFEC